MRQKYVPVRQSQMEEGAAPDAGQESGYIVATLMMMHHQLKLYHWQTTQYARHKAIDKFLKAYAPLVDQFVETYQGALGRRVRLGPHALRLDDLCHKTAPLFVRMFARFLERRVAPAVAGHPDLTTIKDEILAHTHQLLYLFTLE